VAAFFRVLPCPVLDLICLRLGSSWYGENPDGEESALLQALLQAPLRARHRPLCGVPSC
jgi:hypothetical protein